MPEMAFSIDAVLKHLLDRLQPDLSIARNLTREEQACCEVVQDILVETAKNHASLVKPMVEEVETPVDNLEEDPCHCSESSEDDEPRHLSSIEEQMSAKKLEDIWRNYLSTNQRSCLMKHRITYAQLRAVKRHFLEGSSFRPKKIQGGKIRNSVAYFVINRLKATLV